jgi:ketosteroid isomerase-like protein
MKIRAYNAFDIDRMLEVLSDQVVFENFSNGELTQRLEGKEAFKVQAEKAATLFSQREQVPVSWQEDGDTVTVEISYFGVLADDLPNGMKAGETVNLEGKSTFRIAEDKIVLIRDES